jgi:hypothetical protein
MTDQPPGDRIAELEARIDDLERRRSWRASVDEGRSGMETAFWAMVHTIFPSEARKHLRVATREQLMAARVYLDRWIARLDAQDGDEGAAKRSHEEIPIE